VKAQRHRNDEFGRALRDEIASGRSCPARPAEARIATACGNRGHRTARARGWFQTYAERIVIASRVQILRGAVGSCATYDTTIDGITLEFFEPYEGPHIHMLFVLMTPDPVDIVRSIANGAS
jgi:hypothetical protein